MWWKRWRYLTQNMEDQLQAQLVEAVYNYQLALMSNSMLSSENFNKVQKEARELFERLESNLKPWLSKVKADREKEESANYKEIWKRLVGFDPDDRQAVAEWDKKLKAALDAKKERMAAEAGKVKDRMEFAAKKIQEIKQKRLNQQRRR